MYETTLLGTILNFHYPLCINFFRFFLIYLVFLLWLLSPSISLRPMPCVKRHMNVELPTHSVQGDQIRRVISCLPPTIPGLNHTHSSFWVRQSTVVVVYLTPIDVKFWLSGQAFPGSLPMWPARDLFFLKNMPYKKPLTHSRVIRLW